MKKIIAVFLSVIMLLSVCSVAAFAAEDTEYENNYPYILVHGLGGWGSYEDFTKKMPYWGGWGFNAESDITRIFGENGIEAYAASVGPVNSAWDRACEVYAQLTGTVVDYGEAHSKAHNHDRFGYSYEGNQLMPECWDGESKLNFVGHSFGVPAVRYLASLLAFGDEAEMAATGEDTSPLFKGGMGDAVHAVICFAGTNNGSPIANILHDTNGSMFMMGFLANLTGALFGSEFALWNLQLGHFGLTPKQGENRAKLSVEKIKNFVASKDNAGYDLTVRGALELNEKIKTVPTAYYYSYTSIATETNRFDNEMPISSMFVMFKLPALYIGRLEGKTLDGVTFDKSWELSDGIVPFASQKCPLNEVDNCKLYEEAIANGEAIEPGVWYYMEPMRGFDHFDYCGTVDYPTSFEDFYFSMVSMVNSR